MAKHTRAPSMNISRPSPSSHPRAASLPTTYSKSLAVANKMTRSEAPSAISAKRTVATGMGIGKMTVSDPIKSFSKKMT